MAKKSAKSKGFRRQAAKKPYLTKKEIGALCTVLVLLAIGAFFLFRYDDGALKVQDGAVVADGDDWLIVDGSNVRGRSRYFKLGEMGEIDGYDREKTATLADANVPEYVFTPAGESDVTRATVTCGHSTAQAMAEYTRATLESMSTTEVGELQTAELAGRTVRYYLYTSDAEKAAEDAETADDSAEATDEPSEAAEEPDESAKESAEAVEADEGSDRFTRAVAAYIDASHDSSVIVHAEGHGDTLQACPTDEALTALVERAVAAVTLEEGK